MKITDLTSEDRERLVESLKAKIAAITANIGPKPDFSPIYGEPTMKPIYSHPRVWVNKDTLPRVIENLSSEEHRVPYERVLEMMDLSYGGDVSEGQYMNMSVIDVARIECLAFGYLTMGEELYGYTAIHALKRLLRDAKPNKPRAEWDGRDLFYVSNLSSCLMGAAAEVYDWCYPLLTDADREYIVDTVTTRFTCNLEVDNPPMAHGCVTGHSTHIITLRDWLSFAIAVADEHPEIYTRIMGLIEHYYSLAANWYYRGGTNPQGPSYGVNKAYLHLLSEALVKTMSGKKLYAEDISFAPTTMTMLHYLRPDDITLHIGDFMSVSKHFVTEFPIRIGFYGGSYYAIPQAKAWAKYFSNDFKDITFTSDLQITPLKVLIFNDPSLEVTHEMRHDMPLVNYNGSPIGALVARSAWGDNDAWMTYTKIGESYQANHEHKDAGTFQVYYKGILAMNSNTYAYAGQGYFSPLDIAYNKQTVSKNGLLIYNPKYEKGDGWVYSGGQTTQGDANRENPTLEHWLSKRTSRQAKELAHEWSYDKDGRLRYAYISGDITNAYDEDTAGLVKRSTVSVATEDARYPLLFVVHDSIVSCKAEFKKTFLLHTSEEPSVKGSVTTLTSTRGDYNGKLVNTTLLPEKHCIETIGGEGKRFFVMGENRGKEIPFEDAPFAEVGWGRVEISTSGSTFDTFLNVMYVCDADKNYPYVEPRLVRGNTHEGCVALGKCVMLSAAVERTVDNVSFVTAGDGELDYIVTDLEEGDWRVKVNGEYKLTVSVTPDGGIAEFTAQTGSIELSH